MQGYDPKIDAAELVRRHGPEKAQQIIAQIMRDSGMGDRNADIWSGLDVRTAQRGMEPADLSDGMAGAPQSTVGDDAGLDGQDGSGRDWGNWSPGMPLPAEGPDKSVLADNARRAREAERVAANSRERNEAIGQKYGPQAQEIAEAGDARGVTDYDATRTKAEQGRIDYRRQLEMDARHQGPSPQGAARAKLIAQDRAEGQARKAFRDKLAATPDAQAAKADLARRQDAWRAQSMLAGGQPTGGPRGTKAAANAWTMMGDPGITDEQQSSLRYMLPGGQLAAGVDANNAQQAGRMAQSAMTAFLTNNPAATPEQRMMLQDRLRQQNPASAGAADIANNKADSPEAQQELLRLAQSYDTGWFGVNDSDSQSMAKALMGPPYNLRQPEAEALAARYMNKRSWFGVGAPQAPAAGSSPYNPPAPHGL